jgi:hypothetical protein
VDVITVDMWFDPICPWSWRTSRWLLEVERERDVHPRFHVMSLALLNRSPQDDVNWGPARVAIAAERSFGNDVLRDLYTALGTRLHRDNAPIDQDLYAGALAEVGLPVGLRYAAETRAHDRALAASHEAALDPVGTPVLHLPGPDGRPRAFLGPVVTPTPAGATAGELWDGLVLLSGTPGFFELKRGR